MFTGCDGASWGVLWLEGAAGRVGNFAGGVDKGRAGLIDWPWLIRLLRCNDCMAISNLGPVTQWHGDSSGQGAPPELPTSGAFIRDVSWRGASPVGCQPVVPHLGPDDRGYDISQLHRTRRNPPVAAHRIASRPPTRLSPTLPQYRRGDKSLNWHTHQQTSRPAESSKRENAWALPCCYLNNQPKVSLTSPKQNPTSRAGLFPRRDMPPL